MNTTKAGKFIKSFLAAESKSLPVQAQATLAAYAFYEGACYGTEISKELMVYACLVALDDNDNNILTLSVKHGQRINADLLTKAKRDLVPFSEKHMKTMLITQTVAKLKTKI